MQFRPQYMTLFSRHIKVRIWGYGIEQKTSKETKEEEVGDCFMSVVF